MQPFLDLGVAPVHARAEHFEVDDSPCSLYTSVHYVVDAGLDARCTAEIQVRTLAEELWGEVDHAINYPHKTQSLACREQIKALARATSSCSRLVDAIYRSNDDFVRSSRLDERRARSRGVQSVPLKPLKRTG
jgi:putative GTP pyrophosphokinase